MRPRSLGMLLVCTLLAGAALSFLFPDGPVTRDETVLQGARYIGTLPSTSSYADDYLAFRYPAEALGCPLPDCVVTYRFLDAWFNVVAIADRDMQAAQAMGKQTTHAREVLPALLPEWRTANLHNTTRSKGSEGVALDTACILGYLTKDESMAQHVLEFLDDDRWIPAGYYITDSWRMVADESWCVRLLAQHVSTSAVVPALAERLIADAEAMLTTTAGVTTRAAILFHLIALLHDVDSGRTDARLQNYGEQLAALANEPGIVNDTFLSATILEGLLLVPGDGMDTLRTGLLDRLVQRQEANGSWVQTPGSATYPIFTTLRVLSAVTLARELRP